MKKIFLAVLLFAASGINISFAQTNTNYPSRDFNSVSDSTLIFKNVIVYYLELKNALTRDDSDSAKTAAEQLYNAIDKAPMNNLPAAYRSVWMKYNEKLSSDAKDIKSTDDIDNQREHFKNLSDNIYQLLKAIKVNPLGEGTLYYQYCPMVKSYWVSELSNIVNPYEGSMMPTCGTTKDILKTAK